MGYACPVCETPQRDGEHLANHLAFTAMLHGDDHEDWLDEHVDDWGDRTPMDLASSVTEFADESEYDEVFEDTTGGGHSHRDQPGGTARPDATGDPTSGAAEAVVDEAVESVMEEARELTEEMYSGDAKAGGDTGDDDAEAGGDTGHDDSEAAETADEGSDGRE